jgi:hypothetical protein
MSGAGPRSLGDAGTPSKPKAKKKEGSAKKKTKSSKENPIAPASSLEDPSLADARASAAALAHASAFPALSRPFMPEGLEGEDEEIDEEAMKREMEEALKAEQQQSVGKQGHAENERICNLHSDSNSLLLFVGTRC